MLTMVKFGKEYVRTMGYKFLCDESGCVGVINPGMNSSCYFAHEGKEGLVLEDRNIDFFDPMTFVSDSSGELPLNAVRFVVAARRLLLHETELEFQFVEDVIKCLQLLVDQEAEKQCGVPIINKAPIIKSLTEMTRALEKALLFGPPSTDNTLSDAEFSGIDDLVGWNRALKEAKDIVDPGE